MHRCGRGYRSRIWPILTACVGLLAVAGCTVSTLGPENPAPAATVRDLAAPVSPPLRGDHSLAPAMVSRQVPSVVDPARQTAIAATAEPPRHVEGDPLHRSGGLPGAPPRVGASASFGGRWHIATLQFARASASLAREEYTILKAIVALRGGKGGRIEVVGHAERGNAPGPAMRQVNELIAQRRAVAVADGLVALGLPRAAVAAAGHGDREPLYAETSAAGRAGNRRAEIYLLPPKPNLEPGPDPDPPVPPIGIDAAVSPGGDGEILAAGVNRPPGEAGEIATQPDPFTSATDASATAPQAGDNAGGQTKRIAVASLYFGHGSSRLGARERAIVEAAAALQRQTLGTLVIVGHASAAGGGAHTDPDRLERANCAVAAARAKVVGRLLAARGLAGDRVSIISKGADEPAFAEDDAMGEAGNRRVEIYIDLPADVRLADHG